MTTEADDTSAATEEAGDGDESAVFEEAVDADTSVLFEEVGEVDDTVQADVGSVDNIRIVRNNATAAISIDVGFAFKLQAKHGGDHLGQVQTEGGTGVGNHAMVSGGGYSAAFNTDGPVVKELALRVELVCAGVHGYHGQSENC